MHRMNFGGIGMRVIVLLVALSPLWTAAATAEPESHESASSDGLFEQVIASITNGKVALDVNLRWENAKIDRRERSNALAVRTRLGYGSRPLHGVSGFVEFENVASPTSGSYFDGVERDDDGQTIIADPSATEANRFWLMLDRQDWGGTSIKVGRQRIKLDDDRWVGNVGWRQNEQTYDAVRLQTHLGHDGLLIQYIFAWETHRIFGDRGPANRRDFGMKSHLMNLSYDFGAFLRATGFVYLIDVDRSFSRFTTNTFGVRLAGRSTISDALVSVYEASWAYQQDGGDGTPDYDAFYYHVAAGLDLADIGLVKVGYEVLGSDSGNAQVLTPLATAHKFNGYADAFLTNGGSRGLRDIYVVVAPTLPVKALTLKLIFHQFYSDQGSRNLGQEVDAVVLYQCNQYLSFMYKLAYYDEGGSSSPESRTRHFVQTILRF